jgi:tryptophan-rich sensory protein
MARPSAAVQLGGFVFWFLVCFAAAGVGGFASANAGTFYRELSRPDWAPPAWLFGPVWTLLYTMQAIAAWLVWREHRDRPGVRTALWLFAAQIVANGLWSWLFFAWRLGAWSSAEIVFLWILIVATIVAFWRIHRVAAVLLVPYLLWVSFATALNIAIWQRNPGLLG